MIREWILRWLGVNRILDMLEIRIVRCEQKGAADAELYLRMDAVEKDLYRLHDEMRECIKLLGDVAIERRIKEMAIRKPPRKKIARKPTQKAKG